MLTATQSIVIRRRWLWQLYLVLVVVFLLLLHRRLPAKLPDLKIWRPSALQPSTTSAIPLVLRPSDYVDESRLRIMPESDDNEPASEPKGIGTLHDQRYEIIPI